MVFLTKLRKGNCNVCDKRKETLEFHTDIEIEFKRIATNKFEICKDCFSHHFNIDK